MWSLSTGQVSIWPTAKVFCMPRQCLASVRKRSAGLWQEFMRGRAGSLGTQMVLGQPACGFRGLRLAQAAISSPLALDPMSSFCALLPCISVWLASKIASPHL